MITAEQYYQANKAGLKHHNSDTYWSYYTPVLQIAYDLGHSGIDITTKPVVTGFRFGGTPERMVSYNYATNQSENGLSVYLDGMTVRAEFEERGNKKEYTGILVDTGGDDEAIILPFAAENWDD